MHRINDAIQMATNVHWCHIDKAGYPIILHCLRVGLSGNTIEEQVTGILHDILEESKRENWPIIMASLNRRFGNLITNNICALTRNYYKEETYKEYINRIANFSKLAIDIKMADLKDNLLPWRMDMITSEVRKSLSERYTMALHTLLQKRVFHD